MLTYNMVLAAAAQAHFKELLDEQSIASGGRCRRGGAMVQEDVRGPFMPLFGASFGHSQANSEPFPWCQDGFVPDIVSYNSLMKALMKTARTRDVEELFWQMKVASVDPDVVTIKTMRWALGRQRVKEPTASTFRPFRGFFGCF